MIRQKSKKIKLEFYILKWIFDELKLNMNLIFKPQGDITNY